MKSKAVRAAAATSAPINVVVTVTRFVDILAPGPGARDTAYTMKLPRKDPRALIRGDNIVVNPPGGVIRFKLVAPAGSGERYFPAGITFLREGQRSANDRQRLGLLNFRQAATRAADQTITITDGYVDGRKRVRYKFSLLVQRGSDGRIGIIDPGIEHDGDP